MFIFKDMAYGESRERAGWNTPQNFLDPPLVTKDVYFTVVN